MAKGVVFDSSALLASLFEEPGGEIASAALRGAAMSAVNCSEVVARQLRNGADLGAVVRLLDGLGLEIIPWDADLAREAADLSALAWTHGLSLGDRACLATARHLRRPVLTAERNWRRLPDLGIEIRVIR
jgi:PIN domain nuclease of toxin-antitoxin system